MTNLRADLIALAATVSLVFAFLHLAGTLVLSPWLIAVITGVNVVMLLDLLTMPVRRR